jgi:transcriptional regulator with XRE-family HTH domain
VSAPVTSRFGALLRSLRKEAGLTQATLAERAHISQRGLQDLERGVHQAPRRDTLDLLAAALGLSGSDHAEFITAAPGRSLPQPGSIAPLPRVFADALAALVGRERELVLLDRFLAGGGMS